MAITQYQDLSNQIEEKGKERKSINAKITRLKKEWWDVPSRYCSSSKTAQLMKVGCHSLHDKLAHLQG